jgi:hypothetical protein
MVSQDNLGCNRDQVAGGFSTHRIEGQRCDSLAKDRSPKRCVGVGIFFVQDVIAGARVQLTNNGLGERHLCMKSLYMGREHWNCKRAHHGRKMCGLPRDVVAASAWGRKETKKQDDKKRPKTASPSPGFHKQIAHLIPSQDRTPRSYQTFSERQGVSSYA